MGKAQSHLYKSGQEVEYGQHGEALSARPSGASLGFQRGMFEGAFGEEGLDPLFARRGEATQAQARLLRETFLRSDLYSVDFPIADCLPPTSLAMRYPIHLSCKLTPVRAVVKELDARLRCYSGGGRAGGMHCRI